MNSQATPQPQIRTDSGAVAALVLGIVSLGGLLFPPLLGVAIAGIVLGWTAHRRIARTGELKGNRIAIVGIALSVVGMLLSLVLPGFVVWVWIYAAFHGGQLPGGA